MVYQRKVNMSNKKASQVRYEFRQSARYGIKPNVVGLAFEKITPAKGPVTPESVVDAARPEKAPLHPVFEWDDTLAAENYRKGQARTLIRALVVIRPESDLPTDAYVYVPKAVSETEGPGYYPTEVVIERPDMFASALGELHRYLNQATQSVERLRDAAQSAEGVDPDRMARIGLAVQALQTASAAVQALH